MPRRARVVIPGYLYHITQRGNYRQKIFEDDKDRIVYLKQIEEKRNRYGGEIFAYCLMDNHVHFIVRPLRDVTLGLMFGLAHMNYTQYYHRRRNLRGHLWQGRFYSCLMHHDHIVEAVRYVECNPVRASMVEKAWEYNWSSARAHLGKKYKIIKLEDIHEYIDVKSWKNYLQKKECEENLKVLRERTRRGYAWAPEAWVETVEKRFCVRLAARPKGRPRKAKK